MLDKGTTDAVPRAERAEGDPSRSVSIVFWLAAISATLMTFVVRRTALLPGEIAVMQWVTSNLSDVFAVVGPVLDVAFTGLMPPLLFVLLVAIVWWRWGRYPAAVFALAGSVTGLTKLADLAARPRPTDDLTWGEIVFGDGGYPSGHVVYTVLVFGMLAYLARRYVPRRRVRVSIQACAVLVIVVTGPSRLVEIDHWPADVMAGYLIAGAGLAGAIWVERQIPSLLAERAPRLGAWLHTPLVTAGVPENEHACTAPRGE